MSKILKNCNGFTLVELLISIALLLMLVSMVFGRFVTECTIGEFVSAWWAYLLANPATLALVGIGASGIYILGFFITLILIRKGNLMAGLLWPILLILVIAKVGNWLILEGGIWELPGLAVDLLGSLTDGDGLDT